MALLKFIELFFQEGTSDKVYNAYIHKDDGAETYSVKVEWGRRGAGLNEGKKAIKVSLAEAQKVYDRLVREKTNKGYQAITATVQPAAIAPPVGEGSASKGPAAKKKVGHAAQLLTALEDHELEAHLTNDAMVAQQKLDGIRVITHIESGSITAVNRNGEATEKVSAALLAGLDAMPPGTVVDGEVMSTPNGDEYWLFDVLRFADNDIAHVGYEDRWLILSDELAPGLSGEIHVLPIARGTKDKRALFEKLVEASAEGIVFKDRAAPYKAGRPSSGGPQRKHKLQKSADVVLIENAGNAYLMGVHHQGKLVEVGKVFAGTTNESRALIDQLLGDGKKPVAEVRYLYATDDEQLFQPVFVRLRDDKPGRLCVRSQLKKTNKGVILG